MKIFLDWMHRKLHPMDVKYTQVPQKKGEEEEEIAEMVAEEKEALLLHDMLRGILTIGTLGRYEDPFLPSLPPFEDVIGLEEEEEEEEEETPVVVSIEEPLGVINKKDYEDEKEEEEITIRLKSRERIFEIETKLEDLPLLKEDKERRERARTTLADLFAADPAVREDAASLKKSSNGDCKQSSHKNKKKEEKKKKTTDGKSSSKLLKLMMTRMLKKKIHPESITSAEAAAAKSIDKHDVSSSNPSFSLVYYW